MNMEPKPLNRTLLIERGVCCGSKCTNCPYTPRHVEGSTDVISDEDMWVAEAALRVLSGEVPPSIIESVVLDPYYFKSLNIELNEETSDNCTNTNDGDLDRSDRGPN